MLSVIDDFLQGNLESKDTQLMNKDAQLEKQVGNLLKMDSELAKKNEDLGKKVNALIEKLANSNLNNDRVTHSILKMHPQFE